MKKLIMSKQPMFSFRTKAEEEALRIFNQEFSTCLSANLCDEKFPAENLAIIIIKGEKKSEKREDYRDHIMAVMLILDDGYNLKNRVVSADRQEGYKILPAYEYSIDSIEIHEDMVKIVYKDEFSGGKKKCEANLTDFYRYPIWIDSAGKIRIEE